MYNGGANKFWGSADYPRSSSSSQTNSNWSPHRKRERETAAPSDGAPLSLPALRGSTISSQGFKYTGSGPNINRNLPRDYGFRPKPVSLWSKSRSLSEDHFWSETKSDLDLESRVVWDGQTTTALAKSSSFPNSKSSTTTTHPLLRYKKKKKKKARRWLSEMEKITEQNDNSSDDESVDTKYKYDHIELKQSNRYSLPELKEEKRPNYVSRYHADCYDSDDDLDGSWTLPRIEAVLISEGVQPGSIAQQIEKIKARKTNRQQKRAPIHPAQSMPSTFHTIQEYDNERRMKMKHILEQKRLKEAMHAREPTILPGTVEDPESSRAKDAMDMYFKDIERIRWLAEQQIERGLIKEGIPLPRIVLISSKFPKAIHLQSIIKDGTVLPIFYDYHTEVLSGIMEEIKDRLRKYQEGYPAKSMLWCCQGGPGHLHFLKKTVISKQRIQGNKHPRLKVFLRDIGLLMSKLEPPMSLVHIIGCRSDEENADQIKTEFMEVLEESVLPNVVHFESIDENDAKGREIIGLYFSYENFKRMYGSSPT